MDHLTPEELITALQKLPASPLKQEILHLLQESDGAITPEIKSKLRTAFANEIARLEESNQTLEAVKQDLLANRGDYATERQTELAAGEENLQELQNDLRVLEDLEEEVKNLDEENTVQDLKSQLD